MSTAASIEGGSSRRLPLFARGCLLLGRLALGIIFIVAAYTKLHFDGAWHLRDYHFFFSMAIDSYELLPLWAVVLAGRILPWIELVLGVMLILGLWTRWAAAATSALIAVFLAAIIRAYFLGLAISCGCFGNSERLTGWTIVRDSGFLALSLIVTSLDFLARRRATRTP
jgi:uncharacterized membrane protein YphA (DoxX/SURF4 family)